MKTIVMYYSYTGNAKRIAQQMAEKMGAELYEIKEQKRPGTVSAYIFGSFQAMRQKTTPITPLSVDLSAYDKIIFVAPIWAGMPAPAFNSCIALLPAGKEVELHIVSGSGNSNKEKVIALIERKGCAVSNYIDIKSPRSAQ